MKLLLCPHCQDIFKLEVNLPRECRCGRVTGHYVNMREAVTNGAGVSIAIGTGSLFDAAMRLPAIGRVADRADYRRECAIVCWARPNDGPGNPHTTIDDTTTGDTTIDDATTGPGSGPRRFPGKGY